MYTIRMTMPHSANSPAFSLEHVNRNSTLLNKKKKNCNRKDATRLEHYSREQGTKARRASFFFISVRASKSLPHKQRHPNKLGTDNPPNGSCEHATSTPHSQMKVNDLPPLLTGTATAHNFLNPDAKVYTELPLCHFCCWVYYQRGAVPKNGSTHLKLRQKCSCTTKNSLDLCSYINENITKHRRT